MSSGDETSFVSSAPAADPRIPDKAYFRIGEVAKIADIAPSVLRFWESEFSALKPEKSASNRRNYSRKDVELVLRIRDLLYEHGYTISGARRHLSQGDPEIQIELPQRTQTFLARARKEAQELLRLVEE